jgi:putative hemolysin
MDPYWAFLAANAGKFLLMGGLILLSASFSGSETAIFNLQVPDLNRLRKHRGPAQQAALALAADLPAFLTTILFCNMMVNILFFATSTVIAGNLQATFGSGPAALFGLASLLVIIVLSEVTPKSVAAFASLRISILAAIPLYAIHRTLWGLRAVLDRVLLLLERLAGLVHAPRRLAEEELHMLMSLSREEGVISRHEHDLLTEIIELPEIRAQEIMTPRVDLAMIDADAPAGEAVALARRAGHSKILVRDPRADEVVSWADAREIFLAGEAGRVADHAKPPLFVSEFDRADRILHVLRERHQRLAVVVDEYGGTAGIVTVQDVVEEIVGEIGDEDAPPQEPIRRVDDETYLLSGDVSVRDWRPFFGVGAELPNTVTVGGLATALLGRAPREGDIVRFGNVRLEILAVRRRRVETLRLTLVSAAETGASDHGEAEA